MQTLTASITAFRLATNLSAVIVEAATINPYGNLKGASKLMRDRRLGAVVVVSREETIGLIEERDIVRALSKYNEATGFVRVSSQ